MNFDFDQICGIIKLCKESEIAKFSYGDLRFSFQARGAEGKDELPIESLGQGTEIISQEKLQDFIQQDEIKMKDEELALLRLQDPLKYEELFEIGELE